MYWVGNKVLSYFTINLPNEIRHDLVSNRIVFSSCTFFLLVPHQMLRDSVELFHILSLSSFIKIYIYFLEVF